MQLALSSVESAPPTGFLSCASTTGFSPKLRSIRSSLQPLWPDEDRYHSEVRPRTLPLRQGICILQELLPSEPDGATGLNWYTPTTDAPARNRWVLLSGPYGDHNIHLQNHGYPVPDATINELLYATPVPKVSEEAKLKHAYNMTSNRGYPTVQALNALVRQMGVEIKDIKIWFAEESKAQ